MSEFIDLITRSVGFGRSDSDISKLHKFESFLREARMSCIKSFKIFEAILPLFKGNMLYFSISSCSRVFQSLILIDFWEQSVPI